MSQLTEELQKQIVYLQEENKLRTNWISLITHDLKDLFGSYIWLLNAFEQGTISQTDFLNMLPEIKEGAIRNLKTVTDTTEWIKTQYGNFHPRRENIFTYELYLNLKRDNASKLEAKNLTLRYEGNTNVEIYTDPVLTAFILNRIVENAIQFSFPSGVIDMIVYEEKKHITIIINDYGQGIPPNTVEQIFTFDGPKFEGTAGEKGAGLSLKIVREFVKLLNAKIIIQPQEKGTSVHIQLPHVSLSDNK